MEEVIITLAALSIPIVLSGTLAKPWFAYRHRKLELEASMVAEKAAQYAARTWRARSTGSPTAPSSIEDVTMNPAEMILLLAVLAVVASLLIGRQYYAAEERKRVVADPEADRLRIEVRELRERLQVLERVVTDTHSTAELDRRIERLRV